MFKKIMPRVLAKRERTILLITIGVILFSIVFNLLVAPFLTRNDALNKEIYLTRTKLKKYLLLLSQKEYIQKKYSASSFQAPKGDDAFLQPLAELENLAKDASIRIIDIRPKPTLRSSRPYKEDIIDLRTEGTADAYLKFIYEIENSLSLFRIKRLQISAKPNTSLLEGNFSISQPSVLE